jgi:hypothetical protein
VTNDSIFVVTFIVIFVVNFVVTFVESPPNSVVFGMAYIPVRRCFSLSPSEGERVGVRGSPSPIGC